MTQISEPRRFFPLISYQTKALVYMVLSKGLTYTPVTDYAETLLKAIEEIKFSRREDACVNTAAVRVPANRVRISTNTN